MFFALSQEAVPKVERLRGVEPAHITCEVLCDHERVLVAEEEERRIVRLGNLAKHVPEEGG